MRGRIRTWVSDNRLNIISAVVAGGLILAIVYTMIFAILKHEYYWPIP